MTQELILYATPEGPLADRCEQYFRAASTLGPNAAQRYPPHCTLTGFFHRSPARGDAVVGRVEQRLAGCRSAPSGTVTIRSLTTTDRWVGLELDSPWLIDLTAEMFADDEPGPDGDAVRCKDWLHLSLAYDVHDLSPYAALATDLIAPDTPATWSVGLWERSPSGAWHRRC